jgi:hypothetical protein
MTAGRAAGLAAIGLYGVVLAAAGLLAAAGSGGTATAAARGGGERVTGRPVGPAPVVAPRPGAPSRDTTASSGSAVPTAAVGADIPARPTVFAPLRLLLPDGTAAPVVPVGLHADGALVIPDDVRTVGWWTGGSKAGEAFGSVVVAGHVDSAARGIGVFAQLKRLVPGQVVELDARGQVQRYRIVSALRVPQARLAQDAGIFRVDGAPQLVLITCGGAFDRARHRYQDNLVVLASPLP